MSSPGARHLYARRHGRSKARRPARSRVRSALDLLSAAYALDPAFAEAEIVMQGAGARPAFPDNRPRIIAARRAISMSTASIGTDFCSRRRWPSWSPTSSRPARSIRRYSLQILLNGEPFATDARDPRRALRELGFAEAKIATAVNGRFVAAAKRAATTLAPNGRDRDRGAEAGRLMLETLRRAIYLAAAARHGAISLAGDACGRRSRRRAPRSSPSRCGANRRARAPAKASGR